MKDAKEVRKELHTMWAPLFQAWLDVLTATYDNEEKPLDIDKLAELRRRIKAMNIWIAHNIELGD